MAKSKDLRVRKNFADHVAHEQSTRWEKTFLGEVTISTRNGPTSNRYYDAQSLYHHWLCSHMYPTLPQSVLDAVSPVNDVSMAKPYFLPALWKADIIYRSFTPSWGTAVLDEDFARYDSPLMMAIHHGLAELDGVGERRSRAICARIGQAILDEIRPQDLTAEDFARICETKEVSREVLGWLYSGAASASNCTRTNCPYEGLSAA